MAHYEDEIIDQAQAQAEHDEFMNRVEPEIHIIIGPDSLAQKAAAQEYLETTGTDNPFEHRDLHDEIWSKYQTRITLRDISWNEANAFAEPLRIAHPDQNVSLYTKGGSWIGHTTWNDQMTMFFGYPVYTSYGEKLKAEANAHAEANGIPMAWE